MEHWACLVLVLAFVCLQDPSARGATDPGDVAMLEKIRKVLSNPELLQWPNGDDDPCGNKWQHVFCLGNRVSQIQVQDVGLNGPLPEDLNKLTELENLGLQRNNFTGKLPSFSGLSKLQYAFLDANQFDTFPEDFFGGLTSLQVLSLSENPLNESGWMLPMTLQDSANLANLSLINCNLAGPLPDFLGNMRSLTVLQMSGNRLSGEIPASYGALPLQTLWLNDQKGIQLSGYIDAITSMIMLRDVWLHGNAFSGSIPGTIGQLASLQRLWLNSNQLVGVIPEDLTSLTQLQSLRLDNNFLVGPIPKNNIANFSFLNNPTCQDSPGVPCDPEVSALLDFLSSVNYPLNLAKSWSGNDPCNGWLGVSCSGGSVSTINLPNFNLNGTISSSLAKLQSLVNINLQGNHLNGTIPEDLTSIQSLRLLNVSSNNLEPPVPRFSSTVEVFVDGNLLIQHPGPPGSPDGGSSSDGSSTSKSKSKKANHLIVILPMALGFFTVVLVGFYIYRCQKKGTPGEETVIHSKDATDTDNNANARTGKSDLHHLWFGNLVISFERLRRATQNFSPENELGRGGFGVVYKGEMPDGSAIAVKRMEIAGITKKGLDEFRAEIEVLSRVRHRNLVSLRGYSIEGNERLLVYEYMSQGALSSHLFKWRECGLEPLSWKRRLNIALDVARAMEYLHSLAQNQVFIHRDLKPSNILLDNQFQAKVSDFGLVKLTPDGSKSMYSKVAGTFGYVAPEYAATGKVTKKIDVYSFGVVLLELVTGKMAIDYNRADESQYLLWWFDDKLKQGKLQDVVDPVIDATDSEILKSITKVVELSGHCRASEPRRRPDMGFAVNFLSTVVERWKPRVCAAKENKDINCTMPLHQMVQRWKDEDNRCFSSMILDNSNGSIPAKPVGFAESFVSLDGR